MAAMRLEAGGYRVDVDPARGGSLLRFDYHGEALFRPTTGRDLLDVACFPLVPYCNRIADGRFGADGRTVRVRLNAPAIEPRHAIHGYGWQAAWTVLKAGAAALRVEHRSAGSEWPWPYRAEQNLRLVATGLIHEVSVENQGATPMPVGLGLHPYLPRDGSTLYRGLHRSEWRTGADRLPAEADRRPEPRDWWDGSPVETRTVDAVYGERAGSLEVTWPDRNLALAIEPSPELCFTHVYTPADADAFCVEPVSQIADAVNRPEAAELTGLRWLPPGEQFSVRVRYQARRLG